MINDLDKQGLLETLKSPFKENVLDLIIEQNKKTQEYLLLTKDRFSSSPEQLKKHFNL